MSIIKMINMARQTHGDLDDLHTYICSASKTKDGTLIGTNNILSKMHVMEMQTVKKVYNKTDKRQCAHMVVSLTPDRKDRSDQLYLKTANQIAQLFPDFQCFYAIHTDSALRHMHFVWNSVSCLDGHKFELGTPDIAAVILERLIKEPYEIVLAVTQPDRPKGRGHEMAFSAVKETALKYGIPVFQPEKLGTIR